MNEEQQAKNISEPFAEAQRLLDEHLWDSGRALCVQGERVIIFFNPSPTEDTGRFDVPVTVRALEGSSVSMEGSLLVLRRVGPDEKLRTYKERINKHGLAIFRGVEKGSYRPTLMQRESLISSAYATATKMLTDLRLVLNDIPFAWQQGGWSGVALAKDGKEDREQIYRNADESLTAILEPDAGSMLLRILTTDDRWVGKIIPFSWVPLTKEVDDLAPDLIDVLNNLEAHTSDRIAAAARLAEIGDSEVLNVFHAVLNDADGDVREAVSCALAAFETRTRFFTILAWDEMFEAYVAEVNLRTTPKRYELSLPERAMSSEELSPSMIPVISKSIRSALTENHDRMAWRQLLERDGVHPRIRSLIEDETSQVVTQ